MTAKDERARRLAAELRLNLRRRKAQAKERVQQNENETGSERTEGSDD